MANPNICGNFACISVKQILEKGIFSEYLLAFYLE
jgi:hypothetical protein